MIEKTTAFKSGDDLYETLEGAQAHFIGSIILQRIKAELERQSDEKPLSAPELAAVVADELITNKDRVVDVLTTSANSKPKARKINGGTKRRSRSAVPTTVTVGTLPP